MIKYAIALGFFLAATTVFAQEYKIQGRVTNEKSEGIPGAIVMLLSADTLMSTTLADEKGGFEILNVPRGDYRLMISEPAYESLDENISLTADKKPVYTLRQIHRVELQEVEITADRSNVVTQTATGTIFRLSASARKLNNPFEALREIPKLVIDESQREVKTNDGKSPLILINGVRTGAGISTVDPRDIEAVELIDFPSARYLKDGVSAVLNIKVRRKQYAYYTFNGNTRHSLPPMNGNSYAGFETGSAKYSLYLTGMHFYFHEDETKRSNEERGANYLKTSETRNNFNMQNLNGNIGGDYVFSDKDYLSYSITYTSSPTPPTTSEGNGLYTSGERASAFTKKSSSQSNYYVNSYNVYHKHDFDEERILESTLSFNLNGNRMNGNVEEIYAEMEDNRYNYYYDNHRLSASLEVNYSTPLAGQSLDLGSYASFRNDRIEQLTQPVFPYREWNEYLYADFSGKITKKLAYSASLGADLIFNRSAETENSYVRLKTAASLRYRFNAAQSLALAFRQDNDPPSIGALNPYNTSTNPLSRTEGNPKLTPEQRNAFAFSYDLNKSGLYLAPSFTYTIVTDNIVESGRMQDDIFIQSYINEGSYSDLDGGLTLRYNNSIWGYVGGKTGYRHSYYTANDKGSFYINMNANLRYKKVSLNSYIYYQRYYYNPISVTRQYAPESELIFGWKASNNLTLNAGMRYFLGGLRSESVTESSGYYSKSIQTHIDRRYLFNIGFSYYWRNKAQTPQRNKKQLQSSESGISL